VSFLQVQVSRSCYGRLCGLELRQPGPELRAELPVSGRIPVGRRPEGLGLQFVSQSPGLYLRLGLWKRRRSFGARCFASLGICVRLTRVAAFSVLNGKHSGLKHRVITFLAVYAFLDVDWPAALFLALGTILKI